MAERQPWADEPWVHLLNTEADRLGQSEVARRLDCSSATVSLLRAGTYPSPVERWRRLVLAAFMRETVECPILGAIKAEECRYHRTRPFGHTNPIRVKLYQTCPTCPNNPNRADS